jgi:hypothetical protein
MIEKGKKITHRAFSRAFSTFFLCCSKERNHRATEGIGIFRH